MEGEQSKIVWGGCELIRRSANEQERNGVGRVLSKELKETLINVRRKSDRLMSINL